MIWDQMIGISQKFSVFLERESDLDAKLDAYDQFLLERAPLIDELNTLTRIEDQGRIRQLYALDIKIQQDLESWMKDTERSLEDLNAQRDAMIKVKRASGGYTKKTSSSEGYFFDKKK